MNQGEMKVDRIGSTLVVEEFCIRPMPNVGIAIKERPNGVEFLKNVAPLSEGFCNT